MRLLIFILIGFSLLFQYSFWFGKNGYLDYNNTKKDIDFYRQESEKRFQNNQIIAAEIKDLKEGVEAIEERARLQHQMIKNDEIFYHIVKESK